MAKTKVLPECATSVAPNQSRPEDLVEQESEQPRPKRRRRKSLPKIGKQPSRMQPAGQSLTDWRSIEDDREKYQAYLCSKEWAKLKTAVYERAGGMCERCDQFQINAVHHLTYARKYAENLEDLAGWCKHCHNITHDKHWFDPLNHDCMTVMTYARRCRESGRVTAPYEAMDCQGDLREDIAKILVMIQLGESFLHQSSGLEGSLFESAMISMDALLPFVYYGRPIGAYNRMHVPEYYWILELFGFDSSMEAEWHRSECGG